MKKFGRVEGVGHRITGNRRDGKRGIGWEVLYVAIDNGSAYRSSNFRDFQADAGIRHVHTRPYVPRTDGKAKRFIQTSLRG